MAVVVVLVVDDEPSIVALLTEVLEDEGYQVIGAHNGREAFQIAVETLPDVVLTDINMPQMDGIQLSRQLHVHRKTRTMPVVLMSAAAPPSLGDTSASAFIEKPFDFSLLIQVVARNVAA